MPAGLSPRSLFLKTPVQPVCRSRDTGHSHSGSDTLAGDEFVKGAARNTRARSATGPPRWMQQRGYAAPAALWRDAPIGGPGGTVRKPSSIPIGSCEPDPSLDRSDRPATDSQGEMREPFRRSADGHLRVAGEAGGGQAPAALSLRAPGGPVERPQRHAVLEGALPHRLPAENSQRPRPTRLLELAARVQPQPGALALPPGLAARAPRRYQGGLLQQRQRDGRHGRSHHHHQHAAPRHLHLPELRRQSRPLGAAGAEPGDSARSGGARRAEALIRAIPTTRSSATRTSAPVTRATAPACSSLATSRAGSTSAPSTGRSGAGRRRSKTARAAISSPSATSTCC